MPDDDNPDDLMEELFGPTIYSYPDSAAVAGGVLVPFIVNGRDTRHRMTTNAFNELKEYHASRDPEYKFEDYYRFFFDELLPLVPEAYRRWNTHKILTTNYDFRVEEFEPGKKQLWYEPNEVGGITLMLPGDH